MPTVPEINFYFDNYYINYFHHIDFLRSGCKAFLKLLIGSYFNSNRHFSNYPSVCMYPSQRCYWWIFVNKILPIQTLYIIIGSVASLWTLMSVCWLVGPSSVWGSITSMLRSEHLSLADNKITWTIFHDRRGFPSLPEKYVNVWKQLYNKN